MNSFFQKAADQVSAAADKAAAAAEAKIGASGAEQVKKYGHEAADKIAHIDPADVESQLKSHGINIPGMDAAFATNATTAGKAAVPQTENATTGGVVTKLAAPQAAAESAAAAAPTAAAASGAPVAGAAPEATPSAPAAPVTGTH
ncbi:g429 [Coccomyxa elongata]